MSTAVDLVGMMAPMRVRLDRGIDRQKPCCSNVAIIRPGKGPHAAELRCEVCGQHRGWMRAEALAFVETLAQRFGAPAEPIILRDSTIGDHVMENKQYDNSGILFRNDDKNGERDRDYKGEATISGVGYWVSGWIKEAKNGKKFMTFSFKPKDAPKETAKKSAADEMSDSIPF